MQSKYDTGEFDTNILFSEIEKCFDINDNKRDYSKKHLPRIQKLVENKADLAFLREGFTPASLAACYHLWDIVATIANTRKIPAKIKWDIYGYNKCLLGAARAGNEVHAYDAAVALIGAGAKPVRYSNYPIAETEKIILRDCIHWAVINKNIKLLELFLKHSPNLHFRDSKNRVAIVIAAERKYWPMVSLIAKSNPTDAKDTLEYSRALCEAVNHGQMIVAQDLLKAGALQNSYLSLHGENNYCLHLAVMKNNADILQLLLNYKGNFNRKNGQTAVTGITPLQMALRLERENCIKILLANDHNKMKFNQEEYQSYKKAVKKEKWNIAGMMICAASSKVTAKDSNMILHYIVTNWSDLGIWAENILRYTIKKGGKQTLQNFQNQTPIEVAGLLKNWFAVKIFIEANQNDLKPSRIIRLHYEKVLQQAIQNEKVDIVELLLQQNSPCNEYDVQKGNIALYSAVKINNSQILKLLLEYGADVSQKNQDGETIYDLVARDGESSCRRVLNEQRALTVVGEAARSIFTYVGLFSQSKNTADTLPKSHPTSPRKNQDKSKNKQANDTREPKDLNIHSQKWI